MEKIAHWFMENGWKLREGQNRGPHWLQFAFSPVFLLFAALIFGLEKDYYGFSESLNHMVYWLKLASKGLLILAARLGNRALDIMNHHRPEKRASALRAMISVYMDMGNHIYALDLIDLYLDVQKGLADRADMLSHKASCLLALGLPHKALREIGIAIDDLEAVPSVSRDYPWVVWYVRALLVNSQCLYAQHKLPRAKEVATSALAIAEHYQAHARIIEAQAWIDSMDYLNNP